MLNCVDWYDGQFIEYVEQKKRRCLSKIKKEKDFCVKHFNKNMYFYEHLLNLRNKHIKILNVNIKIINKEINDYLINKNIFLLIEKIKKRNQFLDNNYRYTLMELYDSWSKVKLENQIKINSEYWDIEILSNHFI